MLYIAFFWDTIAFSLLSSVFNPVNLAASAAIHYWERSGPREAESASDGGSPPSPTADKWSLGWWSSLSVGTELLQPLAN